MNPARHVDKLVTYEITLAPNLQISADGIQYVPFVRPTF